MMSVSLSTSLFSHNSLVCQIAFPSETTKVVRCLKGEIETLEITQAVGCLRFWWRLLMVLVVVGVVLGVVA